MHWLTTRLALVLLLATAAFAMAHAAFAGEDTKGSIVITLPADLAADERAAVVGALETLRRPLVVEGDPGSTAEQSRSAIAGVMDRLDDALAASADVPSVVATWWGGLSADGSGAGPLVILALVVAAVFAGIGCEWGVDRLLGRWRRHCIDAAPERFSGRAGYALGWMALEAIGIAAFAAGALIAGWLLLPAHPPARLTLAVVVVAATKARLVLTVARFIFAPRRPTLRLVAMPDSDALAVWRWIVFIAVAHALAYGARDLWLASSANGETVAFLGMAAAAVAFVARAIAIQRVRAPVRDLILRTYGRADGTVSGVARLSANLWHVAFLILVVLDFAGSVYTELAAAAAEYASMSIGSFFVLALVPFAIGGYGALIDDAFKRRDESGRKAGIAGALKVLGQGAILLAAAAFLATAWGADPFAGADGGIVSRIAHALLQVGAAVLLGWTIWQGSKLAIDHCAAAEAGDGDGGEGMGKPGSRLETVLPVIRGFIFVAIVAISAMTALSAMGVDIGPLLAGAGILGLAVGFGAQTLVKDIITGLFYLIEDAFRKGEYIQCSGGKGVVEKISLRSVQLRHHNGPVYTVPFGSMGTINNHSRDWVRIKFQIRVPFDTDLDLMRKVVKRVGQEMEQDPVLGPMFLQPIKSQGVVSTDDSGFLTSVKFMSRPGEQFLIRREAYARIQKAFADHGIEFASRRVTVDSEGPDSHVEAAAAAAADPARPNDEHVK
jgi:small-conductance mechanosensitive channel